VPEISGQQRCQAAALGILPNLRAERKQSGWRCGNCGTYQVGETWMVWVPDSVREDDSTAAITAQCESNRLNGLFGGWCLPCAKRLGTEGQWKIQNTPDPAPGPLAPEPPAPVPGMRAGVLFRWGSLWVGAHWAGNHKRLCVNLIPCITFWLTWPGGHPP
jgi:hypothetical protein